MIFLDDMEEIAEKLMKFKKCIVKFTPICSMGIKSEEDVKYKKLRFVEDRR